MTPPKWQKWKGTLTGDAEDLELETHLRMGKLQSPQKYRIPVSELLEEMIGKEVEITIIETHHGQRIEDESNHPELNQERIRATRELREQLLRDRDRPQYHFTVPEDVGRPGDPNGAFMGQDGQYHLMYLYDRREVGFCWGHVSSGDLVHWHHHPDALKPERHPDGEIDGCFSGGAFVEEDGTAYLSYWIVQKDERPAAKKGIMLAKSSDYHYDHWENLPEVAIPAEKMGWSRQRGSAGTEQLLANADPSNIWKKDGMYYIQTGNLPLLNAHGRDPTDPRYSRMRGDWVDLFRSADLHHWTYVHRFYEFPKDKIAEGWTDGTEDDMCPSFLPLPTSAEGGEMSGKYLQLFIAHNKGCQYYIGSYDTAQDRFIPEQHGRMSWHDNTFFAPEALIDKKGRQIMWAWLLDNPDTNQTEVFRRGWCGVFGLPRVLWLGPEGTLRQTVPPELKTLRLNEQSWKPQAVHPGFEQGIDLEGVQGDACEIEAAFILGTATRILFQVRATPDRQEETLLYYDDPTHTLGFDSRRSSLDQIGRPLLEEAPYDHPDPSQPLAFRIFVDNSVVEIFLNDTQAITRRVFPTRDDSLQITVYCEGGDARIETFRVWEMMPSNSY